MDVLLGSKVGLIQVGPDGTVWVWFGSSYLVGPIEWEGLGRSECVWLGGSNGVESDGGGVQVGGSERVVFNPFVNGCQKATAKYFPLSFTSYFPLFFLLFLLLLLSILFLILILNII